MRVGDDPVALHLAGAVDQEREDHRLPEHHHRIVAHHGIGIARRAGDELQLIVVAKPDFAQAGGFRAAALELLESAYAKSGRAAIGPAGGIDEFILRQLADWRSELQVPDSRQRLRQLPPRGAGDRADQDQGEPRRLHDPVARSVFCQAMAP